MFTGPIIEWFSQNYKSSLWKRLFEKTAAPPPKKDRTPEIADSSDEISAEDKSRDKNQSGGSRKQTATNVKASQLFTLSDRTL